MNVWVTEVIYEHSAVAGVFRSLDEAVQHVRDHCPEVKFDSPASTLIGHAWTMTGVWNDKVSCGPRFVTYRFTQHHLLGGDMGDGK